MAEVLFQKDRMNLYITVNATVEYFEIHIFKKHRKGRIKIEYSPERLRRFNKRNIRFDRVEYTDESIVVNICKWFATYEANNFMGTISYLDPGLTSAIIIKNRNGVEHFLKEWT